MLHEALMLEIYRQALNAGALPTARPRSTDSANSSERCPSHESNSSENGRDNRDGGGGAGGGGGGGGSGGVAGALGAAAAAAAAAGILPPGTLQATLGASAGSTVPNHHQQHHQTSTTFPPAVNLSQNLPAQPPTSMEAYLQMVAAAAQQYGFPFAAAVGGGAAGHRLPLQLPTEASAPFKLPPQASPTASSNNSEALDFRTNLFGRAGSVEAAASDDEEDEDEEANDANNPLDLSVGTRKRSADTDMEPDTTIGQIQVKKIFKTDSPPLGAPPTVPTAPTLLPSVNPYLAAVAAANIFRSGQFPDWNGKSDLVVDPLEKMSDIVKGPRKEKTTRSSSNASSSSSSISASIQMPSQQSSAQTGGMASSSSAPGSNALHSTESGAGGGGGGGGVGSGTASSGAVTGTATAATGGGGMSKARHNIWQSHWQNKGVASSVFRCVWCKQSFATLEALTTHMKDSKHCGVNVPPFGNLPNTDRHHHHHHQQQQQHQHHHQQGHPPSPHSNQQTAGGHPHSHNLRKQSGSNSSNSNAGQPSAAAKNAFQYRGDPPTPLPRKLVRGQNVWLGKGVEQAMQILKCMRCGESFRSLGEMTKHMQETQHYTNILSQEQTISMKSSGGGGGGSGNDGKDGHNSLSSEESRTLSAVLTCKVCDKAFNSLGDLSNHMAKNNHYAEPLMQSMGGGAGNRKRPAPKKREKSLPVRKLLEMKGASQNDHLSDGMDGKMQRSFENAKRLPMDGAGIGPGGEKSEAAMFAERMRQYISSVKSAEETAKANLSAASLLAKTKSPELEAKNGATKTTTTGTSSSSSSVLSAIEQMFTTSFDTPPRHASLPATSPSNSSTKNTSPVASSILKRLGIDETVDYNKPLMDTSDPYYQHFRYTTSSERSGSECSAEIPVHVEPRKMDTQTSPIEKMQMEDGKPTRSPSSNNEMPMMMMMGGGFDIKKEPKADKMDEGERDVGDMNKPPSSAAMDQVPHIKMEIKSEVIDDEETKSPQSVGEKHDATGSDSNAVQTGAINGGAGGGSDYAHSNNNNNNNNNNNSANINNNNNNNNNNNSNNKERSLTPPNKIGSAAHSPLTRSGSAAAPLIGARSPTDSHRSITPKSPASSIKSYDGGEKKYPSDSLNALSSMFDSLGSSTSSNTTTNTVRQSGGSGGGGGGVGGSSLSNKLDSPENLTTTNSLAALRQFCVKKEKTA